MICMSFVYKYCSTNNNNLFREMYDKIVFVLHFHIYNTGTHTHTQKSLFPGLDWYDLMFFGSLNPNPKSF